MRWCRQRATTPRRRWKRRTDDARLATATDEFIKGLWRENPVFVQVLGMCPVLAVTNTAINALAMGLATRSCC
jgi:electron transport complex protein RnfE